MELRSTNRVVEWLGVDPASAIPQLSAYAEWLASEGIAAGGLGPDELDDLDDRHIADSLALADAWRGVVPVRMVDLGSGVGLPGIPLAITHPDTETHLVERSGSRCRLLRRAVRIIGLTNVAVVESSLAQMSGRYDVAVARAVASPSSLLPHMQRLVTAEGVAVVSGSRTVRPVAAGFTTREIVAGILDRPCWILIMDRH